MNLKRSPLPIAFSFWLVQIAWATALPAADECVHVDRIRASGTPTVVRERCASPRQLLPGSGGDPLLENGDFSLGLASWTATQSGGAASPGAATADASAALLSEGDSFLVTLEQSFTVPERARELVFRLTLNPGFDRGASFIPDAFEVSLLDDENAPVIGTWDSLATSSFNLSETGAVHASPQATWDGTMVRIDLSSVPVGAQVTLFFDLIGADQDTASALRLDDVEAKTGPPPGSFVRGDHDGSGTRSEADADAVLAYLFTGGTGASDCLGAPGRDTADANDNESITIADYQALRAALAGAISLAEPSVECGFDPSDDRRGFDSADPTFRVSAGELELLTPPNDESPKVALPILVDSPRPLSALTLILQFDSGALTPFATSPLVPTAAGARSASRVDADRVVIAIWSGDATGRLTDGAAGTFQRAGTVSFDLVRFRAVRPFRWLAEIESGGFVYRSTLVDEAFADHHPEPVVRAQEFVRGNSNADVNVDISDGIFSLTYLFVGGDEPVCLDSADANDDGLVDITDPIFTFTFLFLGGPSIASPYPECGIDAGAADLIGCGRSACPQ